MSLRLLHTMHLVAFNEALIFLVNSGRSGGEGLDVVIEIPAQVLIKHRGHEMEFFVIVFLRDENRDKTKAVFEQWFH